MPSRDAKRQRLLGWDQEGARRQVEILIAEVYLAEAARLRTKERESCLCEETPKRRTAGIIILFKNFRRKGEMWGVLKLPTNQCAGNEPSNSEDDWNAKRVKGGHVERELMPHKILSPFQSAGCLNGCLKGTVDSVIGKGGPRPSVGFTRGRYTVPHNILSPFPPAGGPLSRARRTKKARRRRQSGVRCKIFH